ncbi:hypothetical protein ERJ75_001715500 [Trypanosoma vivax]|nr:hypothetical protein ERJ75_001715500 [Trypanosoma vivax]
MGREGVASGGQFRDAIAREVGRAQLTQQLRGKWDTVQSDRSGPEAEQSIALAMTKPTNGTLGCYEAHETKNKAVDNTQRLGTREMLGEEGDARLHAV